MPFCPRCGAEIYPDAVFCPKCGSQVAVPPTAPLEHRYAREKHEKREEEKEEKHEKEEKSRDRTGPIIGGLILIWLGITFYLAQMDYITWRGWWAYFLFGIGVILLVQAAVRYSTLAYKGPAIGSLIGGLVLITIGLTGILGIREWWPLIFIAIGIVIIVFGVTAMKHTPKP